MQYPIGCYIEYKGKPHRVLDCNKTKVTVEGPLTISLKNVKHRPFRAGDSVIVNTLRFNGPAVIRSVIGNNIVVLCWDNTVRTVRTLSLSFGEM